MDNVATLLGYALQAVVVLVSIMLIRRLIGWFRGESRRSWLLDPAQLVTREMETEDRTVATHENDNWTSHLEEEAKWLRTDAEGGDTAAMLALAGMYASGEGLPENYEEAFEWCQRAAELGNEDAYLPLAIMYRRGRGTLRDDESAFPYFLKAAEKGSAEAMIALGRMYACGVGVGRNEAEAAKWYVNAERVGDPRDLTALGNIYLAGDDAGQDYKKAMQLYLMASEQEPVYMELFGLQPHGAGRPWHADPLAMIAIGRMYAQGLGVPQDRNVALDWFAKAVQTGDPCAAHVLSDMYHNGDCVEKDELQAAQLHSRAVKGEVRHSES